MQAGINISNSWKTTKAIYTNINTTWKSCKNIYINVSGTWKPIWSYSWKTGNWGNCTQTAELSQEVCIVIELMDLP